MKMRIGEKGASLMSTNTPNYLGEAEQTAHNETNIEKAGSGKLISLGHTYNSLDVR